MFINKNLVRTDVGNVYSLPLNLGAVAKILV